MLCVINQKTYYSSYCILVSEFIFLFPSLKLCSLNAYIKYLDSISLYILIKAILIKKSVYILLYILLILKIPILVLNSSIYLI